jgi:hypothetical protein
VWLLFVFDPSHGKGKQAMYWMPSLLLTLIAMWGVYLRGPDLLTGPNLFIAASIAFAVLVAAVVFVLPRYKIAVDPFLMIVGANVINWNRRTETSGTGTFIGAEYAISRLDTVR